MRFLVDMVKNDEKGYILATLSMLFTVSIILFAMWRIFS